MSLFKQFKTNEQKEVDGVEVHYEANEDGSVPTFIIARAGGANQHYGKVLNTEFAPYRRLMDQNRMTDAQSNEVGLRAFIKGALKGWSNVQDENGKDIPYSYENAVTVLTALPNLRRDLEARSMSLATFQDAELEIEAKNS